MNEREIKQLVDEIENVDFREFRWGSKLLERASRAPEVRVVRALALRHHGFSNKAAFSAHVVRNAIKIIDAPDFQLSWSIIDAEEDTESLIEHLEDFRYAPWAIAYVLGEIGGFGALQGVAERLTGEHSARHYMIVRIASHLLVRYLQIQAPPPRTMTVIDVTTGATTRGTHEGIGSPTHKMDLLRRSQADELFTLVEPPLDHLVRVRLKEIPDSILNLPREQFYRALDMIPKRST